MYKDRFDGYITNTGDICTIDQDCFKQKGRMYCMIVMYKDMKINFKKCGFWLCRVEQCEDSRA